MAMDIALTILAIGLIAINPHRVIQLYHLIRRNKNGSSTASIPSVSRLQSGVRTNSAEPSNRVGQLHEYAQLEPATESSKPAIHSIPTITDEYAGYSDGEW